MPRIPEFDIEKFSPEQKRYLEGFVSGLNAARATRGVLPGAIVGAPCASASRRRSKLRSTGSR